MKLSAFLLLLTLTIQKTFGFIDIEPFGTFGIGSKEHDETLSNGQVLDHSGTLYEAELGLKTGLNISPFGLGVLASYSKSHWDGRRSDQSGKFLFDSKGYDSDLNRTMTGCYLDLLLLSRFRISVHYYNLVKSKFYYSDTLGENPFDKNDQLIGKGGALGISYVSKFASAGLMFRRIDYNKRKRNGVETTFPSNDSTKIETNSVLFVIGIPITLF